MKAITVCQPYPWLMLQPESDPRHKRVENRNWATNYRGDLAIHAGISQGWLSTYTGLEPYESDQLIFGAVVGIVRVVACWKIEEIERFVGGPFLWVKHHQHTQGPFCWVFDRVRALKYPQPCKGAMGLWEWQPAGPMDLVTVDREAGQ